MAEADYHFTLIGAPVEAEGEVDGKPFYFRARGEGWTCALSEDLDMDPVGLIDEGADTALVMFLRWAARRVMRGVRFLPVA